MQRALDVVPASQQASWRALWRWLLSEAEVRIEQKGAPAATGAAAEVGDG